MWIPKVAVLLTWSIAVQVRAACEQLDGDFSISGSWRGNVIINRIENPVSLSDITKRHGFAPIHTAPHRSTDKHQTCSEQVSFESLQETEELNTAGLADFFHLCIIFKETTS